MIITVNAEDADRVWACCQRLSGAVPYWFDTGAALWRASVFRGVAGAGGALFSHFTAYAEVQGGEIVGFVQTGVIRFGLADGGKDFAMRYGIIRTLWCAPGRKDAGLRLIWEAQACCGRRGVALAYAFFIMVVGISPESLLWRDICEFAPRMEKRSAAVSCTTCRMGISPTCGDGADGRLRRRGVASRRMRAFETQDIVRPDTDTIDTDAVA